MSTEPQPGGKKSRSEIYGPALVAAAAAVLVAVIGLAGRGCASADEEAPPDEAVSAEESASTEEAAEPVIGPTPAAPRAELRGRLTDTSGQPIGGLSVGVRGGPETRTDSRGDFVLGGVATGNQMLVVKAAHGQLTQNVRIEPRGTTPVSVVYDAATSQLGLLSVVAPLDDSVFDVRREGDAHRAFVHGRCDGLGRVLGSFDVWVLIRAEGDQSLWVQHPAAVIDPTAGTWQASVLFGDRRHRPYDGQRWTILAAAAPPSSGFNRLTNAPSQTGLPPHVASNVATVRVRVVGGASPGATTR